MPSPIPQPPKAPLPSTIAEQPPLANLFGIQNEWFNRYMGLIGTKAPEALEILEGCVENLGESHPILQYAAGSAATELALRTMRQADEVPYSFEKRAAVLGSGREYCLAASEGLFELSKKHVIGKHRLQLAQLGVRALHLAAYTPLIEVIAANIADHFLSDDILEAKRTATRGGAAQLGQLVLGMNSDSAIRSGTRAGLQAELACGVVGLGDASASRFLLPASLRQDHNRASRLRADLTAMEVESPFRKQLLQVGNANKSGSRREARRGPMHINASRDLVLHPDWGVDRTIETFIAIVEGTASPETEQLFLVKARSLSEDIAAYAQKDS